MASNLRTAAASSVAASDSDDTGRPEDTPVDLPDFGSSVEAILDGGIGSGGFSSLSSSSSARRLSVLTDMACSRPAGDTDRMPLAGLPIGGITPAALPPPPIEDQNSLVMALRETVDKPMPGQSRFVVSKRWMRRWEGYVGWNTRDWSVPVKPIFADPPGPITNEDILEADGSTLRECQDLRVDFVDGRMWELLSGWYGGNPIQRLVIEDNGCPTVELYQLQLKLTRKGGSSVDMALSKSCTVGDLRREGIAALQIGTSEECEGLRLHVMTSKTFKLCELDDDGKTLSHFFSLNNAWVQFELPGDEDGNEGGDDDIYSYCTWGGSSSFTRPSATPGAVGLHNLGNTCFMNAAIQCLSHIPQVVEYFGEKDGRQPFLDDLNVENPLGTKGELARAFGDLVKCMWEGKESCVYPRDFRDVLCDHAQQFLGYEQHDSQEFLAYLLDGIHEDVNRVREKPFVEKVEAISGECDDTAAHRSWDAHLQRNDSFVVDTMHGQYKSVVTCPVEGCQKTSTTFDPAMYLSLPLPVTAEKSVELVLASLDGSRPKRYAVLVSKSAKVKELRQSLAKVTGKREDRLAFTQVWLHKIHDVFEDDHSVSDIRLDELVTFELLEWPQPPPLHADDCDSSREDTACGRGLDGNTTGGGLRRHDWEQKLAPFLLRTCREKELRSGSDADGRSHLFRDAKNYLAGFPSAQELAELTSKQEAEGNGNGNDELGVEMQHRLRQASIHSTPFTELTSLEEVAGFSEAVQSLKELVLHEQREVRVQIIQHRSSEYDRYTYSKYHAQTTTPFCFPLLASYLPHSTTVGEFRNMLATVLRRFVLPRDAARKGTDMDIDSAVEQGEIPSAADSDPLSSTRDDTIEHRIDGVVQLFRSGELELLSEESNGHGVSILSGRGDRDDDLVANSIDESAFGMSRLILRWSEDALREAFDASEVHKIEDDASVAACRNHLPETLSVSQCVDCFLEREQLDESEMWYCSSCKVHRRAFKLMHLWRLPPVLVIHLKRFSYDTFGGWAASREKIESFVSFPVRGLDLRHLERVSQAGPVGDLKDQNTAASPTTGGSGLATPASGGQDWVMADQQQQGQPSPEEAEAPTEEGGQQQQQQQTTTSSTPAVYDLGGVVNHYGGLGGGHYTANALNMIDNRWYEYSDDRVSVLENEADLVTSAAYVLFYSRRGASSKKRGNGKDATASPEGGGSGVGGNDDPGLFDAML